MPVAVERRLDRGVAELSRNVLRVRPLSDQETCVGVAQVVEPDTAELRTTKHAHPVPVSEVVRIDRLAVRAAKDEAALQATRELGVAPPAAWGPGLSCGASAATSV